MWISKPYFDLIAAQAAKLDAWQGTCHNLQGQIDVLRAQKIKDDLSLDWMRHRVNALEKQNAVLIAKAAGVHFPVPEIVPVPPGTMTVPDFSEIPALEDVGDTEAMRLGVQHDSAGGLIFTK